MAVGRRKSRVDSSQSIDSVWFFHIPKTGGRFFYSNSVRIAEQELIIQGRQYKDILIGDDHYNFTPLDNQNILSFATIRNPVSRTVSHWRFLYQYLETENIKVDKQLLLDFLEKNPESGIIDYQTKYIALNQNVKKVTITDEDHFHHYVTHEELELAKKRISKVNYVFRTEEMGHDITKMSLDKIRKALSIAPTTDYFETKTYKLFNDQSTRLLNSLSKSDISKIENYMKNDMELYESINFFDKKTLYSTPLFTAG